MRGHIATPSHSAQSHSVCMLSLLLAATALGGIQPAFAAPSGAVIDGVRAVSDLLALHWPQQEGQSDEDELPNRPALLD